MKVNIIEASTSTYDLEEVIFLAQRMNFYIYNLKQMNLSDLRENEEALNLTYMYIEQLVILIQELFLELK